MAFQIGQQLQGGKYAIEAELGRGRFGVTYLSKDPQGNLHAIKTLNDDFRNQPNFDRWQESFVQEAMKLLKCCHHHIVNAEELFLENGLRCIVMEYVPGVTLDRLVTSSSPLSEADALRYIRQIGEALIFIHKKGLIHRDVKPSNIVIRAGKSEAVLIDFGLARKFDHPHTTTSSDTAKGFSAPEMAMSDRKRGPHTDVYSLAATLYYLLTGQPPEDGEERLLSMSPKPQSSSTPPVKLTPPIAIDPQIKPYINEAIVRGLAVEIESRPRTVPEWLSLLEEPPTAEPELPETQPIATSEVSDPTPKPKKWDAMIWLTLAIALGTILGAIGTLMGVFKSDSPSPSPNPPAEVDAPAQQ